jgi:hypothetical protein
MDGVSYDFRALENSWLRDDGMGFRPGNPP